MLAEKLWKVLGNDLMASTGYLARLKGAGLPRIAHREVGTRSLNMLALGTLSPLFVAQGRLTEHQRADM